MSVSLLQTFKQTNSGTAASVLHQHKVAVSAATTCEDDLDSPGPHDRIPLLNPRNERGHAATVHLSRVSVSQRLHRDRRTTA